LLVPLIRRHAADRACGEVSLASIPTDRRQEIVLADDPVAVLHEVDEQIEHLRLDGNRPGAAAPLTSVGIKHVVGKKKSHLVVRTDDDVSMNYHAHLHRKSSARQSLWTAIRVSLRALEAGQNSWTVYLARPNYESMPMVHALFILFGIGRIL